MKTKTIFNSTLTVPTMVLSLLTTAQICLKIQTNEEHQKSFKRLFNSFLEKLAILQNENPVGLFPSNSTIKVLSAKVKELLKEYPVDVTQLLTPCKKEKDPELLKKQISAFVLEEKEKGEFRVWFNGILHPPQQRKQPIWKPVQERQVYGFNTLRHTAIPPAQPLVVPVCSDDTVIVDVVPVEAVVPTAQQPTFPKVMQAVAKVRNAVPEAQLVRPVPLHGNEESLVQLNTLGAAPFGEMRVSSTRVDVFNDFDPSDEEEKAQAPAGHLPHSDDSGTPPLELPPDESENASEPAASVAVEEKVFDDGEEPNKSLVVIPKAGDKKGNPRIPGWMVDHTMPDLVRHPQLAVVCSKLPVLPFLRTVKSVWNIPSGVEVVMADSPNGAILKVETGGGQMFVALMKSGQLIAPPASGLKRLLRSQPRQLSLNWPVGPGSVVVPPSLGAGGGSGGFRGRNAQSGCVPPALPTGIGELQFGAPAPSVEDIAEDLKTLSLRPRRREKSGGLGRNGQRKTVRFAEEDGGDPTAQLSPDGQADSPHIRPVGPESVLTPPSGGAHKSATFGDTSAQLLDHTQAGDAQQSIGQISQTTLRSVDRFSGGLGGQLPKLPGARDTSGGHGGDTQPASFEASSLLASLGAGSVFECSSYTPSRRKGQWDQLDSNSWTESMPNEINVGKGLPLRRTGLSGCSNSVCAHFAGRGGSSIRTIGNSFPGCYSQALAC